MKRSTDRPLTLLHISDPQFGKNHRFAQRDLSGWDAPFDTLLARLQEDLHGLREQHGLAPDLLVVTGDLAEWGLRSEFEDALKFLRGLCYFLRLPLSRVAIIPGNHDINRSLCEGYFSQCKGLEQEPAFPYWPKWELYAHFFNDFYGDTSTVQFTEEIPWSLFAIEDLKIVVAGLNSTMKESHREEDHYGWVGERQLTWFREQLERYQRDGWLRIGAVHHNYRRGPTRDDENLRDADDLRRVLRSSLNLLFHGHTHDGKLDWIHPGLPVLSTGSAALKLDQRPSEVPNQYQIVQIWADRFRCWTRGFAPDEKRWIGNNRASGDGGEWWAETPVNFQKINGTFPASFPHTAGNDAPKLTQSGFLQELDFERRDDFLARVAAVCRLRDSEAEVERLPGTGAFGDYLRVIHQSGNIQATFPVGAVEHSFGQESFQAFLNEVDARYRRTDTGLISYLVYGGTPAPAELAAQADARRVRLLSFVEYQGLIDFRNYLRKQTEKLFTDPIYPPRLYVPQRMRTLSLLGREDVETEDALAQVRDWLDSPHGRFLVLLGDFGTGKTFLLHELARRMGEAEGGLVPILLQMRSLEKGRTLDALLAQHFAQEGMEGFSPSKFRYMLEQGRIALLFDGFDELALRVTYAKAADHFETLLQAANGNAKVVLTSRRQHFLSESQVKTTLAQKVESLSGHRLAILQPFLREQIRLFLAHFFEGDTAKAEARLDLIDRVKDLLGLSSNPRLLGFIAELPEDQLEKACTTAGEITAAKLYELLLTRWLEYEFDRVHPKGAPPGLSVSERWQAVTLLAMKLWQKTDRFVSLSDLSEEAVRVVQAVGPTAADSEVAAFQVGSGTLLVRDDEGNFTFLHQSILEWLVAKSAAEALAVRANPEALAAREISPLMADFFASLAGPERAAEWAREILSASAGEAAKKNAFLVLERQRVSSGEEGYLVGQDLRDWDLYGQDLSGEDFSQADLSGANLTAARLIGASFVRARLVKATLRDADLSTAILTGADLSEADLTGARLVGADLRGAHFTRARLRRAKLLGATLEAESVEKADSFGAASELSELIPQGGALSRCLAVAWNSDSELLASAYGNIVRLWDTQTGREIRAFAGHQAIVRSIAFSPDGNSLASGSDDGTVRLWHLGSGHKIRAFTGHRGGVRSVAFSPDGKSLASGSTDSTVRVWQVDSEREHRILTDHQGPVRSVAFSPDGKCLAIGSTDRTVRVWQVDSGHGIRTLIGHQGQVQSVVFSPDGTCLASGSSDNTVRLWQVGSGRLSRVLTGHKDEVSSVAFSIDGKSLASASLDKTVRLWQVDSGHRIRTLTGHQFEVASVAFSPDGKTLASGSYDTTIRLWQVDSGREIRTLTRYQNLFMSVAFSPDGKSLASGTDDTTVRLWQVDSGHEIKPLTGHTNKVLSVAFSPNGRIFASGSEDATVRLWQVDRERQVIRVLAGHEHAVLSVAFSPDGKSIASASDDQTIRLWQVDNGRQIRAFTSHKIGVWSVAFSPDGKSIASGSADGAVRLWQLDSGLGVRALTGHQSAVRSVAFSPDGKALASASYDKTVRLWHFDRGRELRTLTGHQNRVMSVAFSPNGKTLASGSSDATIRLWEANSGRVLRIFTGHRNAVVSVAFNPDGKNIASGSTDGTIRLWNVADGRCLTILLPLPEGWVAFSPDGRYKFGGVPAGGFWHAVNLCRFEIGELDDWVPGLRLADDASFFDLPPWKPEIRVPSKLLPRP